MFSICNFDFKKYKNMYTLFWNFKILSWACFKCFSLDFIRFTLILTTFLRFIDLNVMVTLLGLLQTQDQEQEEVRVLFKVFSYHALLIIIHIQVSQTLLTHFPSPLDVFSLTKQSRESCVALSEDFSQCPNYYLNSFNLFKGKRSWTALTRSLKMAQIVAGWSIRCIRLRLLKLRDLNPL